MEVRDPVHGSIAIDRSIEPILDHKFFKRLRGIKQLGLSEFVFPGATHTRYIHSLGVMNVSEKVFEKLFKDFEKTPSLLKLRETLKLGCLLHDIGHAPLSHSTELVMPQVNELELPDQFVGGNKNRQATHEDYTVKAVAYSSFTESFKMVNETYGVDPLRVAELILGRTESDDYFTYRGVNYFPLLHQLVSSELDCDRMDYLLRDSYFCGVSYGHFDLDWIIDNLAICIQEGKAYLGIGERAISTFDDFLLCRYHMFIMVYFHYKSVCMEKLLAKYFETDQEYSIPADIEDYQVHDDHYLMSVLRSSKNKYAQSIVQNKIPEKIFESFNPTQYPILEEIETYLKENNIEYIKSSSKGRLSKYYEETSDQQKLSLKVSKTYPRRQGPNIINISEATDLFEKYSAAHSISRLHCWKSQLTQAQQDDIQNLIVG